MESIVSGCKNAAQAGIDVHLTVMVGYPWERREDAERTIVLAKELMSHGYAEMLQATVVVPYPGTDLYKYALENDLFRFEPKEYNRYDMTESVLRTPDMRPEEVMRMCERAYGSFLN